MEKPEDMKMLINLLIRWLKEHGHTEEEIVDCIEFITQSK